MKRFIILTILLAVLPLFALAQSPEQVVRQYVSHLNDWLASPYSSEKRAKVLSILNGGESAMKDKIVENYNSDAGKEYTSPGNYLAIFYEKTTVSRVKVEIVSLKEKNDDGEKYVTAVLKYSGGISLSTASDFWISGGKITGIVSNEREIAKLRSGNSIASNTTNTPTIQNNTNTTQPVVPHKEEHEYVDLGLPSGTLWATCNVGASSPEDYGSYFAWGETKPKYGYSWETYKYGSNPTKYNNSDGKKVLDYSDDAAYQNWGSDWCMPTIDQLIELKDQCTWKWTTRKGKKGYLVTSKKNGNTLFLPAAGCRNGTSLNGIGSDGYYWSRSLLESKPDVARGLSFCSGGVYGCLSDRHYGQSVRLVRRR